MTQDIPAMLEYLKKHFKPHPWHGISLKGKSAPYLNVFIEIVPTDTVKYELDKESGYLSIDRPQKFSNFIPALYGFLPRTYCDKKLAAFACEKTGRDHLIGDGDPLDICVLSERPISHGDLLLQAKPIGGFRMIDNGEVDDKIIAVLKDDPIYGDFEDIEDCPSKILARLKHYFLTYKDIPGEGGTKKIEIHSLYNRKEAQHVIDLAAADYAAAFPEHR
ncbi:MAG: inorganic pyrophosphatase [Proteobacteria bacterium]|nr:inorganic pyrophosphatase [Pseudomonadota bacterium]